MSVHSGPQIVAKFPLGSAFLRPAESVGGFTDETLTLQIPPATSPTGCFKGMIRSRRQLES